MNQNDIDYLKQYLNFWPHLKRDEEDLILNHARTASYQAGNTVYSGDYECTGILLVRSGELRTYILSEDGRDITLYRLGEGEICILSASCILSSITFDVHIDAEKDTEVLVIPAQMFLKISSQNVYVENFALKVGMERFSDVMWAMEQILFMSFDRRLAVFLLDETTKSGEETLALTHEQIARYMGSAREVVSRMLKHFSREGIVELYRGGIKVIDKEKLKHLV